MPRYFFDVRTDQHHTRDETGIDLPDAAHIWPEITRLIHDCVYARPDDSVRFFDVTVRDANGATIERSTSTAGPPPAFDSRDSGRLSAADRGKAPFDRSA
jgi:hypothetical protein